MSNRTAIIVITWNNTDDAVECMDSLLAQTEVPTILSVDNNSRADEQQKLQQYLDAHPEIVAIQTGYNGGTAGGFNAGVDWAIEHNYDYIGTLNADAIADEKWVASLHREITTNDKVGIATGILARRDGKTIDTTGDFYTTWGIPGPRGRDQPIDTAPQEAGEVFGSTGGGFIARTAMYRDVGRYDEAFFMYFEDVDMSFRAQLRGWRARYTPTAIAYHKLGASSSTVPGLAVYHTFKNLPMLFIKNVPFALWGKMYPRFIIAYTLILLSAIRKGRGYYAIKGWLMSWRYLFRMMTERRRIQSSRQVTTNYIDSILIHDIPPDQKGLRKFRAIFSKERA